MVFCLNYIYNKSLYKVFTLKILEIFTMSDVLYFIVSFKLKCKIQFELVKEHTNQANNRRV